MERPAVFYCLALAVGLVLGERFPGQLAVLLAVTLSAGLFLFFRKKGPVPATLAAAFAFVVLGYVSIQPWVAPVLPDHHIRNRAETATGAITGRVTGLPYRSGKRIRFLMEVEAFNQQAVCGNLRVSAVGSGVKIHSGDRLQFRARVKSIRNFNNPGAFDYRRYLMLQKVWATAWVRAEKIKVLKSDRPITFKTRIARVRADLSGWITATVPTRAGSVLKALVTGDRSGIERSQREQFNRLGIGHLLAISGLHIGIIAAACFSCFHRLMRCIPWLQRTGRARQTAGLLTIAPVVAYGLLAGMSPATQRAVIMVVVFLLTVILDRQPDSLNTLAVAGLGILVLHPPALFSVSFQLSFTAVFTIIYGLACLPARWRKPMDAAEGMRWPARLIENSATFGWVSLLAILGTLPLSMHYFNQVSRVGLFTNCIYIPVIGFLTVPLALAGTILSRALDLAEYLSGFSWVAVHTVTLNWFEVALAFSLLTLGLRSLKSLTETGPLSVQQAGPLHPVRSGRFVLIGLAAVGMLLAGDIAYWLYHRFWHRDLRVTCIDVRQGSAALVEFPGGTTMLVDGGGYTDNAIFDMGARVVAPFLWSRKIRTVDILVLSHPNSDHLNGLLYIADRFRVGEIWTNGERAPTAGFRRLMAIVKERQIKHPNFSDLPSHMSIGGATVTRLYPRRDFLERATAETWRRTNNNSLVVRVALDGSAFLFAGDLMRRAEAELVTLAGDKLKSPVLFVPHHGSKSSSSMPFIRAVKPEVAVISAGQGNRYRFPSKAVLERYAAAGSRVYRTDRDGAIMIRARGGRLEIETAVKTAE
jgi:competence protein ComEC